MSEKKIICDGTINLANNKIDCYVTEDGVRVLSGRQMQSALGLVNPRADGQSTPGSRLVRFLGYEKLKPFIFKDFVPDHFSPIKCFKGKTVIHGYRADLLADICDGMLDARRADILTDPQKLIADQCEILIRGFARVGIIALIDEATGYQDIRARDALAKILEKYLEKEYHAWTKTFPVEFYKEIARLKKWDFLDFANGKIRTPSVVGHYTNDFIYARLSPGVLEELEKRNPILPEKGRRKAKHHQWFNPKYGHPLLKEHLAAVIALMKASTDWRSFERNINRAFPKIGDTLSLDIDE